MRNRTFVVTALAATLFVGACKKDPPPPPAPTGPSAEELERIRIADSIAAARAAEDARLAEERRAAEAERARLAAIENAKSTLTQRVHFDYDRSEIRPEAERILQDKLAILRASPAVRLRVEGHADERGSNEYNVALGNRRAQAVVDFFTNFGIDASRFTIVSYGEERPLQNMSSESAWAQNRRAEFVITAGENEINPGRTP